MFCEKCFCRQDWEVVLANGDHDVGETRSIILRFIVIIFTIIGAILLLNLLIALMATTYDDVKEISKSERAFVKTQVTSDLLHRGRLMAPPLNLIVLIFAGVLITAFVLVPGFLSTSCNPYVYISLLNPFRYKAFAKDSMIGDTIRERTKRKNNRNKNYKNEFEYLKRNKSRFWWITQHRFCRNCYCCIADQDKTSIDNFMNVLKKKHKLEIEPTDKAILMRQSIGIYFCPSCFRNFKKEDLYTAFNVSLDFFSFYVFLLIVLPPIAILLCFPSLLEKCVTKRDKRRELTEKELIELHQQYDRQYNVRDENKLLDLFNQESSD